jgi:hypothetical protein
VIKKGLPATAVSSQVVHDLDNDPTNVEMVFRTAKTAHLETRPASVRIPEHTRLLPRAPPSADYQIASIAARNSARSTAVMTVTPLVMVACV